MLVSRKSARFSPSSSVAYAVSCSAAFRAVTRDLVSSVFMIYIFDLDGTLYNKKGLKIRMIFRALQAKHPISMLAMERSSRREISGIDTGNITYETLFEKMASRSGKSIESVRAWYESWYMPTMVDEIRRHFPLRPGIKQCLEGFKAKGDRMAILSDYGCIREKLDALGLDASLFDELIDAPSIGGYKPAPTVFKKTLKILGAEPKDCLMIGDRPERDGGSERVGVRFLYIDDFMKFYVSK